MPSSSTTPFPTTWPAHTTPSLLCALYPYPSITCLPDPIFLPTVVLIIPHSDLLCLPTPGCIGLPFLCLHYPRLTYMLPLFPPPHTHSVPMPRTTWQLPCAWTPYSQVSHFTHIYSPDLPYFGLLLVACYSIFVGPCLPAHYTCNCANCDMLWILPHTFSVCAPAPPVPYFYLTRAIHLCLPIYAYFMVVVGGFQTVLQALYPPNALDLQRTVLLLLYWPFCAFGYRPACPPAPFCTTTCIY